MPETRFHIRWPDGTEEACYSPSTIVMDHFAAGASYPLAEFGEKARTALEAASERVRQRFGMGCAHAMSQARSIENTVARLSAGSGAVSDASVTVIRFQQ